MHIVQCGWSHPCTCTGKTGGLLLVFIDNCELLHLVRRQVSSQAGFNLFKNLVSRELFRILENFHFSISISKHFEFTFHFSKKSESICFSLCTSRKRVKAFFFHFALLEKEWKLFFFTFHFSNFKNPLSLVPALVKSTIKTSCHSPPWWSPQSRLLAIHLPGEVHN